MRDRIIYDLAQEYENRCEAYDKTVCSGTSRHEECAMPIGSYELKLVNLNAKEVMRGILSTPQALEHRITRTEIFRRAATIKPNIVKRG